MSVLEYVLDGLEAELELERELGVRTVDLDRGLLGPSKPEVAQPQPLTRPPPASHVGKTDNATPVPDRRAEQSDNRTVLDLVFLHDRPLSPRGVEMMAKIIQAMGLSAESAPIVVAPPLPRAKVIVVLGGLAMRKFFPGLRGEPGQWQRLPDGSNVLITYSPEYILRFSTVTPAVKKIKEDMWRSLKAANQRLRG